MDLDPIRKLCPWPTAWPETKLTKALLGNTTDGVIAWESNLLLLKKTCVYAGKLNSLKDELLFWDFFAAEC